MINILKSIILATIFFTASSLNVFGAGSDSSSSSSSYGSSSNYSSIFACFKVCNITWNHSCHKNWINRWSRACYWNKTWINTSNRKCVLNIHLSNFQTWGSSWNVQKGHIRSMCLHRWHIWWQKNMSRSCINLDKWLWLERWLI